MAEPLEPDEQPPPGHPLSALHARFPPSAQPPTSVRSPLPPSGAPPVSPPPQQSAPAPPATVRFATAAAPLSPSSPTVQQYNELSPAVQHLLHAVDVTAVDAHLHALRKLLGWLGKRDAAVLGALEPSYHIPFLHRHLSSALPKTSEAKGILVKVFYDYAVHHRRDGAFRTKHAALMKRLHSLLPATIVSVSAVVAKIEEAIGGHSWLLRTATASLIELCLRKEATFIDALLAEHPASGNVASPSSGRVSGLLRFWDVVSKCVELKHKAFSVRDPLLILALPRRSATGLGSGRSPTSGRSSSMSPPRASPGADSAYHAFIDALQLNADDFVAAPAGATGDDELADDAAAPADGDLDRQRVTFVTTDTGVTHVNQPSADDASDAPPAAAPAGARPTRAAAASAAPASGESSFIYDDLDVSDEPDEHDDVEPLAAPAGAGRRLYERRGANVMPTAQPPHHTAASAAQASPMFTSAPVQFRNVATPPSSPLGRRAIAPGDPLPAGMSRIRPASARTYSRPSTATSTASSAGSAFGAAAAAAAAAASERDASLPSAPSPAASPHLSAVPPRPASARVRRGSLDRFAVDADSGVPPSPAARARATYRAPMFGAAVDAMPDIALPSAAAAGATPTGSVVDTAAPLFAPSLTAPRTSPPDSPRSASAEPPVAGLSRRVGLPLRVPAGQAGSAASASSARAYGQMPPAHAPGARANVVHEMQYGHAVPPSNLSSSAAGDNARTTPPATTAHATGAFRAPLPPEVAQFAHESLRDSLSQRLVSDAAAECLLQIREITQVDAGEKLMRVVMQRFSELQQRTIVEHDRQTRELRQQYIHSGSGKQTFSQFQSDLAAKQALDLKYLAAKRAFLVAELNDRMGLETAAHAAAVADGPLGMGSATTAAATRPTHQRNKSDVPASVTAAAAASYAASRQAGSAVAGAAAASAAAAAAHPRSNSQPATRPTGSPPLQFSGDSEARRIHADEREKRRQEREEYARRQREAFAQSEARRRASGAEAGTPPPQPQQQQQPPPPPPRGPAAASAGTGPSTSAASAALARAAARSSLGAAVRSVRDDPAEHAAFVAQLVSQLPWLTPALLQPLSIAQLRVMFVLPSEETLARRSASECEAEMAFIAREVLPLLGRAREELNDLQLQLESRYFGRHLDYVVERVRSRDFYARLGVERAATASDIKRAYHRLIREWHPDHMRKRFSQFFANESRYTHLLNEVFVVIDDAYRTLCDDNAKLLYDQKLRLQRPSGAPPAQPFAGVHARGRRTYPSA